TPEEAAVAPDEPGGPDEAEAAEEGEDAVADDFDFGEEKEDTDDEEPGGGDVAVPGPVPGEAGLGDGGGGVVKGGVCDGGVHLVVNYCRGWGLIAREILEVTDFMSPLRGWVFRGGKADSYSTEGV